MQHVHTWSTAVLVRMQMTFGLQSMYWQFGAQEWLKKWGPTATTRPTMGLSLPVGSTPLYMPKALHSTLAEARVQLDAVLHLVLHYTRKWGEMGGNGGKCRKAGEGGGGWENRGETGNHQQIRIRMETEGTTSRVGDKRGEKMFQAFDNLEPPVFDVFDIPPHPCSRFMMRGGGGCLGHAQISNQMQMHPPSLGHNHVLHVQH